MGRAEEAVWGSSWSESLPQSEKPKGRESLDILAVTGCVCVQDSASVGLERTVPYKTLRECLKSARALRVSGGVFNLVPVCPAQVIGRSCLQTRVDAVSCTGVYEQKPLPGSAV